MVCISYLFFVRGLLHKAEAKLFSSLSSSSGLVRAYDCFPSTFPYWGIEQKWPLHFISSKSDLWSERVLMASFKSVSKLPWSVVKVINSRKVNKIESTCKNILCSVSKAPKETMNGSNLVDTITN